MWLDHKMEKEPLGQIDLMFQIQKNSKYKIIYKKILL
jgi:hypothetical protein